MLRNRFGRLRGGSQVLQAREPGPQASPAAPPASQRTLSPRRARRRPGESADWQPVRRGAARRLGRRLGCGLRHFGHRLGVFDV